MSKSVTVDVGVLGYNAVQTCRSIPTFRRNIPPPSSGPRDGVYLQVHTALQA
jgi:hypothetical protein